MAETKYTSGGGTSTTLFAASPKRWEWHTPWVERGEVRPQVNLQDEASLEAFVVGVDRGKATPGIFLGVHNRKMSGDQEELYEFHAVMWCKALTKIEPANWSVRAGVTANGAEHEALVISSQINHFDLQEERGLEVIVWASHIAHWDENADAWIHVQPGNDAADWTSSAWFRWTWTVRSQRMQVNQRSMVPIMMWPRAEFVRQFERQVALQGMMPRLRERSRESSRDSSPSSAGSLGWRVLNVNDYEQYSGHPDSPYVEI